MRCVRSDTLHAIKPITQMFCMFQQSASQLVCCALWRLRELSVVVAGHFPSQLHKDGFNVVPAGPVS